MPRALAVAAIALAAAPATAAAHVEYTADSTSYCLHGRMADGTYTRSRSAASNRLALGTRIRLVGHPGPRGMRRYVIRDRIGWGTSLDLWHPSCSGARAFGRHLLRFHLGWGR